MKALFTMCAASEHGSIFPVLRKATRRAGCRDAMWMTGRAAPLVRFSSLVSRAKLGAGRAAMAPCGLTGDVT